MKNFYEIRRDGKRIASAQLTKRRGSWHLDMIAVNPSVRSSGLGRALMTMLCEEADSEWLELTLEVRACAGLSTERLIAWYEGFGFVLTGRSGEFGPRMKRELA